MSVFTANPRSRLVNRFSKREKPPVERALDRVACEKHLVPVGIPCWHLHTDRGYKPAICNRRAVSAGFVGEVSAKSMRKWNG